MTTHVIVSLHPWDHLGIEYRRHQLSKHLASRADTRQVIWARSHRWGLRRADWGPSLSAYAGRPQPLREGIVSAVVQGRLSATVPVLRAARARRSLCLPPGERAVLWFTMPVLDWMMDVHPWDRIVYDCSDLWSAGFFLGSDQRQAIAAAEDRILERADRVSTSSSYLTDRVARRCNTPVRLFENGHDPILFEHVVPAPRLQTARPRLVFAGGLKPGKVDLGLLDALAEARPDWSIVLAGPADDQPVLERLFARSNVTWLGPVASDRVPGILGQADVGLLPYAEVDYNRGVFPIKLWEHAAAGLPSVACGLPSTRHLAEPGFYELVPATLHAFEAACSRALETAHSGQQARVLRARSSSWDAKLCKLATWALEEEPRRSG